MAPWSNIWGGCSCADSASACAVAVAGMGKGYSAQSIPQPQFAEHGSPDVSHPFPSLLFQAGGVYDASYQSSGMHMGPQLQQHLHSLRVANIRRSSRLALHLAD